MNDIIIRDNLTIADIGSNPGAYPEEVLAAGFDVIKNIESQLRNYKQNITGNMIHRMTEDNATKLPFIGVDGKEKILTLKKSAMKPNPAIKDPEMYIQMNGFAPSEFGEYKFTLCGWKDIKEKRKVGGNMQLLCDELYKEVQPSIIIEEK